MGQKNMSTGRMHLWVQNRQHTWKNVVDGMEIAAVSGELVAGGFRPRASYWIERWDTYEPGGAILSAETIVADAAGGLTIPIRWLQRDVALKVRPASGLLPLVQ